MCSLFIFFFFFNDTATTEIYTLSLHDALPIWFVGAMQGLLQTLVGALEALRAQRASGAASDRKSTRLNSSHGYISYAVFCLKKKKRNNYSTQYYQHTQDQRYVDNYLRDSVHPY